MVKCGMNVMMKKKRNDSCRLSRVKIDVTHIW